ncbi:MAG: NUDIX domain-containing protein [Nitrospinaceae bacterium]|nr:NUDIX hydrolase [Nitrospinaceae bacterium]NIR56514.1 NUDIX hydrolase [Nitrospinaceae bacterium]NIS86972.1 NUDIX hydrolase [Nitrospinaceae bacterium]NIT83816.1 NUDIX hydrolase [Nitrospinaceae bacterium]NIU46022.1 NUDIX hydrolase [Nitrospinaceae bacterium]
MIKKWKTLSRKEVYRNPYWTAYQDVFQTSDGKTGDYFFIHYPGGVEIIAQREDGRILLVEQYRYLYDRTVLSFPGGSIKPPKTAEETAFEELLEETGYRAGTLKCLGERYISPGLFQYVDTFFLATNLKLERPTPGETEEFIYHFKTVEEIDRMMATGEILSGNATCAWTLARPYLR